MEIVSAVQVEMIHIPIKQHANLLIYGHQLPSKIFECMYTLYLYMHTNRRAQIRAQLVIYIYLKVFILRLLKYLEGNVLIYCWKM